MTRLPDRRTGAGRGCALHPSDIGAQSFEAMPAAAIPAIEPVRSAP